MNQQSASQKQAQRRERLREKLLRDHGVYSIEDIANLQAVAISTAQKYVHDLEHQHRVFTVFHQGETRYPKLLFQDNGQIDEIAASIVEIFAGKYGDWGLWAWFCFPTGLLSGNIPKDIMHDEPERVERAARSFRNILFEDRV